NPKEGNLALWVGKATTKEIGFMPQKDAMSLMQGTWRPVAGEEGGIATPPQNLAGNTWEVSSSTATFKSGKRVLKGTITVDQGKSPKWIDLTTGGGMVMRGIYKLNGGTLWLFLAPSGAERPTQFKTKQGTQQRIHTYEDYRRWQLDRR